MISVEDFLTIDLPALLCGVLAAVACAIPGTLLMLRRQALLGDALSHAVWPGIVVAFLLTGDMAAGPLLLGAIAAAALAAGLMELIRRVGGVEPGAAMGAVFTGFFAFGVLLLEQQVGRRVHLDVSHALMGNVEGILWIGPTGWADMLTAENIAALPPQLGLLAVTAVAMAVLAAVALKELRVVIFDGDFARLTGFRPGLIGLLLVLAVVVATVAAFQAVGAILVIAMLTCPPAAARLLTQRLGRQLACSAGLAAFSAVLGYGLAVLPGLLGGPTLSAAGMMAVAAGLVLLAAMGWRQWRLTGQRRHAVQTEAG